MDSVAHTCRCCNWVCNDKSEEAGALAPSGGDRRLCRDAVEVGKGLGLGYLQVQGMNDRIKVMVAPCKGKA